MAGKGDKRRPCDRKAFDAGYERAFGHTGSTIKGRTRIIIGDGPIRRRDSKNIRSLAAGIDPAQIPEAERRLAEAGITGVKYDRETGDCIFADRQSRLKALKFMGYHDKNEIRG